MSIFQEIKNIKSEKSDLKKFGITIGVAFLIIFFALFFLKKTWYNPIIITGIILIGLGYVIPKALLPLQKIWMAFSIIMGWAISHLMLCIVFYAIITPIGIIAKIFGKNFISLRFRGPEKSYWISRDDKTAKSEDYEKQF